MGIWYVRQKKFSLYNARSLKVNICMTTFNQHSLKSLRKLYFFRTFSRLLLNNMDSMLTALVLLVVKMIPTCRVLQCS